MKTVTQHIRDHLEKQIRPPSKPKPPLDSLRETEWSPDFEQYMRNRLVMGAIRYETFEEKRRGHNYACMEYIRRKTYEYEQTGNLECLVDAANVAMIEFDSPTHPFQHFTSGDDTSHVNTFKP